MDSNTYSNPPPTGRPAGSPGDQPNGLAALTAALDQLEGQDLDTLPDAVRAERVRRCGGWPTASKANG
jgi:hypothetical protein